MRLSNTRIGTRLSASFGTVVLLSVALAATSFWAFDKVGRQWEHFQNLAMQKNDAVAEGKAMLANANNSFKNFLLRGGNYEMNFFADIGGVEFAASTYKKVGAISPEEQQALDAIAKGTEKYLGGMREVSKMRSAGMSVEIIDQAFKGLDADIRAGFDELSMITRDQVRAAGDEINQLVEFGKRVILAVAAICVLLGGIFARLTSRSITRPLNEAVAIAQTVAAGDLTAQIEVKSKDETGTLLQALKNMNESLVRIVGEVRTGTETITTASGEIASGNIDLSSRTESQASSLQQTASSMEELTSTVKQNADNARQANTLAMTASDVARKGGAVVSEVVTTMGSINDSAKKIVDIIGVIDGIAFQTNILALNAAVEAARAGEQGRGFAVVASEVRNLAQRSASAAKEIKGLIGDSVEKVGAGTRLVDQAGVTMQEVVDSVQRVTSIMSEIMSASEEQSAGIEQVNQAIGQVDDITQQNAALVEQAAAAAQAMQDQAQNLAHLVSVFKLEAGEELLEVDSPAALADGSSDGEEHESDEALKGKEQVLSLT